ncbi:MAG: cytochrome c oxidase assembly protein [Acidimicrobiales bacterium]
MPPVSPARVELAVLLVGTGAWCWGLQRTWARWGHGRVVRFWQANALLAGVAVAGLATLGPYDAVADRSIAGHMGQHVVLMVVAGPLLACGRPLLVLGALLPSRARARDLQRAAAPVARWARPGTSGWVALAAGAVALHTAVMVAWHVPVLYDLAVRDEAVHALEHLTMTASAVALWSVVLGAGRRRPGPAAMAALFGANVPMTLLGFALLMSRTRWYPVYGTGLDDQQAAGALLWGVGGALVVVEAAAVFAWWFGAEERPAAPLGSPST